MNTRISILVLSIACICSSVGAQELGLFRLVDRNAVVLSSKEKSVLAGIEALPSSREVTLVYVEDMTALDTAQTLSLPLPQKGPLTVNRAYMRIPTQSDQGFRKNPTTDSDGK